MSSQIDVQLKHPFSILVADGSSAGNTTFTKNLLKEGNWLIHPTPQRVIWCYANHQPDLLSELTETLPAIEYVQGKPWEMDSMSDRSVNNLIILDDMMDEAAQDNRISRLFSRGRHDNLSHLTQNLFHKNQREISLNSDYMVIFKKPRDKTKFTNLARQFMSRKYKCLLWAFEDATKLPRFYLLLDMRPERDDRYRVRARIFNDVNHL